MRDRLDLHDELEQILGSRNVYYNRPESVKLEYPCFVYKKGLISSVKADNRKYLLRMRYQITFIHRDPDSHIIVDLLEHFPFCEQDTPQYVSDNLYHDVFTLYY